MLSVTKSLCAFCFAGVVVLGIGQVTVAEEPVTRSAPAGSTAPVSSDDGAEISLQSPADILSRPFTLRSSGSSVNIVRWDRTAIRELAQSQVSFTVERFPISGELDVDLELTPFRLAGPDAMFVLGRKGEPDVPLDFDPDSISLFRGQVRGYPGSHVYLALGDLVAAGRIDLGMGSKRFLVSSKGRLGEQLQAGEISVFKPTSAANLPSGVPICGNDSHRHLTEQDLMDSMRSSAPTDAEAILATSASTSLVGLKTLELAVDTDYEYFFLFGDAAEAEAYLFAMYGAVSDIFMRDVNVRVELVFTRIWTDPNDEFNGPDPLQEFRPFWVANMGFVHRDAAQLLSGRRDYPFGGQAYLNALCSENFGYGIVGYAMGFFPDPTKPSPFEYDVSVTAHELGHNAGTGHTHDDSNLNPNFVDTCDDPNTTPQRGTIMSYCQQTWSGMNANNDNYFHRRIQPNIEAHVAASSCISADCNMNNIEDSIDIAGPTSVDTNFNGVPDECEDCNNNGTLDPADIAGASFDKNGNGIPDECEPDCNNNTIPDDKDIADGTSLDAYGNDVPDECEADCNNNGISDYTEIQADMTRDKDRDAILDSCQDCDTDGIIDLDDIEGAHNLWVGTGLSNAPLREFHTYVGVKTRESSGALVNEVQDVLIRSDKHVLVSSGVDNRIMEFTVEGSYVGNLVAPGQGGLNFPTGMVFAPSGDLLVSSRDSHSVLAYNANTGATGGAFITAGSGGLTSPFGLTVGPDGRLYVTSATNEVLRYNGASGAFVDAFVSSANNGGLDQPHGLSFKADGNLLVASFGTDEVLEFDGKSGEPLGKWAQVGTATRITQDSPWDIEVGPNGHVFVTRTGTDFSSRDSSSGTGFSHLTDARMFEYNVCTGLFRRTHIGGNDHGLNFATGFDFVPGYDIDCNQNQLQDECDIASGFSEDANSNTIPDECEVDCNANGVQDVRDLIPHGTSYDCNCNFVPDECDTSSGFSLDCDGNGVPDECEDCNGNGIGDACDIAGGAEDCNGNGVLDECESTKDCDGNGTADICDLFDGTHEDCNGNDIPDLCDAAGGGSVFTEDFESGLPAGWSTSGIFSVTNSCSVSPVCNGSRWAYAGSTGGCSYGDNQSGQLVSPAIPLAATEAELRFCSMVDTEAGYDFAEVLVNGTTVWQKAGEIGVWEEEVIDLTPYGGQLITITFRLQSDGFVSGTRGWQVDNIRLTSGSEDCDTNSVPDECDPDCDHDGIPNGCDNPGDCVCLDADACTEVLGGVASSRYLSFVAGSPGDFTALRVRMNNLPVPFDTLNGSIAWVQAPRNVSEQSGVSNGSTPPTFRTAALGCDPVWRDWSLEGPLYVYDARFVPEGNYVVQAIHELCDVAVEGSYSIGLSVTNSEWGDITSACDAVSCGSPDGDADFDDISSIVDKFRNMPIAPIKSRVDLAPEVPDQKVDFSDIPLVVDAFRGLPYPYPVPPGCPPA